MKNFKHIHFNDPKDFLTFLEPENKKWFNYRSRWVFRGQAQSDWGLLPKLSRELIVNNNTIKNLYDAELTILSYFVNDCRESGLELPIDNKNHYDISLLTFSEQLYVSSVGQHYGLPTRLLDWTRNRYNSLFFALDLINKSLYSENSNLAIWCLDSDLFLGDLHMKIEGKKYSFNTFYPQFYKNKNLISQSGLFTYMRSFYDKDKGTDYHGLFFSDSNLDINYTDLDFALKNDSVKSNFSKESPVGYKLTISRKYVNFFEGWLYNRFISYNSLFPSYEGASLSAINGLRDRISEN